MYTDEKYLYGFRCKYANRRDINIQQSWHNYAKSRMTMNRIRARSKHGRRESTTNCWIYGSLTEASDFAYPMFYHQNLLVTSDKKKS